MHKNCPNEQFLVFMMGVIASLGSYRFAWELSPSAWELSPSAWELSLRLEVIASLGSYAALPRS